MVRPTIIVSTVTTRKVEIEITAEMVIEMLRNAGHTIPANAGVFVMVPGGGDWSNMRLDIGVDAPLTVRYEEVTRS